jgi:serine/threonine protein kinase
MVSPPSARCPEGALLAQYAAGVLGAAEAQGLADHVRSCAACRGIVEKLQRDEELSRRLRDAMGLAPEAAWRQRLNEHLAGSYEVLETLGQGASGVVFKARDLKLNRFVAIKCLHSAVGGGDEALAAALREARHLGEINHPHVAAIYTVSDTLPLIIMEFVDGQPITEALADRPLNQQLDVFRQTLRAVSELHRRGLVHRDLKPANILVDRRGVVKLVDFGILLPSDAGVTRSVQGTPAYLAPEQSAGYAAAPAADVFSLGVILFELLTGQHPFPAPTVAMTLEAVRQSDPPLPRALRQDIPGALQAICLAALEKDPARRYPTARQFLLDLERFLNGEAVWANPTLLASILEHGIEHHVADLQRWQKDRMISTRECDYFLDRYGRLRQREEFWVLDSRRISFSQVMLHLGVWACVVSAFLMLVFSWSNLGAARPVLPGLLFAILLASGLELWRRRTKRVALVLLMGATMTLPIMLGTAFVYWRILAQSDPPNEFFGMVTNRQLLVATFCGCALAAGLWRHTRTAAFALIWGLSALALVTAICGVEGMVSKIKDIEGHGLAMVAGWYLWPGLVLFVLALAWDLPWRNSAFASPLYVMSLLVVLLSVTLIASQGPTLQWLGLVQGLSAEDTYRHVKFSFMINGALFLAAGFLAERSVESASLRRIATFFFWMGPSHLLIPLELLKTEWPLGGGWYLPEILLPAGALAFIFASVPKQMKSFFFSGLGYLALSVTQLTRDHFRDDFAWPLGLACAGLILAFVAWRYPAVFDRKSRPRVSKRPRCRF